MAFCSNCGTQVNEGVNFCPKCGQNIGAAAPQQQVNQTQPQYVEEEEEVEEKKSFTYRMWHSKWSWIAAAVIILIIIGSRMGGSKISNIEKTTKEIMVKETQKRGSTLVVKDITLTHRSGNEYTGVAECTLDGQNVQFALEVVSDGKTVQAEWELSDVR